MQCHFLRKTSLATALNFQLNIPYSKAKHGSSLTQLRLMHDHEKFFYADMITTHYGIIQLYTVKPIRILPLICGCELHFGLIHRCHMQSILLTNFEILMSRLWVKVIFFISHRIGGDLHESVSEIFGTDFLSRVCCRG